MAWPKYTWKLEAGDSIGSYYELAEPLTMDKVWASIKNQGLGGKDDFRLVDEGDHFILESHKTGKFKVIRRLEQ